MKSNIASKLKRYSMLSASIVGANTAIAQSGVYNSIQDTLNGDQLFNEIDLNQDGNADLKIQFKFHDDDLELYAFECENLATNIELAGALPNGYNYPLKLELGSLISEDIEWLDRGEGGSMGWYNNGFPYFSYWNGEVDSAFIGLRVIEDQDTLLGWVRLSVNNNNSEIVVHDSYLTQKTVSALVSGEGPLLVPSNPETEPKISWRQEDHQLTIFNQNNRNIQLVRIYDITGKQIDENQMQSHQQVFNTSTWARGIYVALIKTEEKETAIKIAVP